MVLDAVAQARKLLESGFYQEAGELFIASGELASAARAFASGKDYQRAALYYEKAHKPLDAARCYFMIRQWQKAAELYRQGGDSLRAEIALEQQKREQKAAIRPEREQPPAAAMAPPSPQEAPPEPGDSWPAGEIWQAIRAGDIDGAVKRYHQDWSGRGWSLVAEAATPEALKGLAETLFLARDYPEAAEAFQKAGEMHRAAQCLSLAGLHDEAAHHFFHLGQKVVAAQHLEKAHAWDRAADIYLKENLLLDAARCHEKNNDPVKAAAVYLKAKQADVALPLLQSIAPSHPSFAQCRLLAGKIFLQKGQRDLATSMLSPILQAVSTTEDGLEALYQAAILVEMGGATDLAREAYRQLQESRFGYKDVTERLQQLPPAAASAPPSTGPTTAPSPAIPPPRTTRTAPAPPNDESPSLSTDLSTLRNCSLFNRLSNDELRRIWTIGKTGECKPGKVLVRVGQVAPGLMLVLSGGITITPDPEDATAAAGFLGPGDYVGLGSLLTGPPQPNALVAQKNTRLLVLPPGALETLLSAEPEMGMRFYRSVAEHLVQTLTAGQAKSPES